MILGVTLLVVLGTIIGAVLYGRAQSKAKSVEEWALGGRRMGTLIFWFLNAGEIYTTFAVLGISGFAWAYGAPAYLAFCSVSLSAAIGYWLMPKIWAAGRARALVTQADFFADHYRARWLGVVVAVVGIAALVVYVQIQITALGLILRMTLGTDVSPGMAAVLAAAAMLAFVFLAGLRSAAFAAGVKDVLMLVLVIALSATVAGIVGASSMADVYARAQDAFPGIGKLPGLKADSGLSTTWLMTSALNVAFANWIFPHMFQLSYSAATEDAIRRNAIFQPIYSLSYFFIILLGLAALLAGTVPPDGDINAVLLQFVSDRYPPWLVGLLAGTACLLALVPGSVLLLTAGSIFARNVVAPLRPGLSERGGLLASRLSMVGAAGIAVYLTLGGNRSLVEIGLSAYGAIGLLAPGVFLAFVWPRTSAVAVAGGLVAGYALLVTPPGEAWIAANFVEWEPGLVAMGAALIVTVAISLVVPRRADAPGGLPLTPPLASQGEIA
ncbi:sodium:solute symporter family protein [Sphingomonas ursincola]|uniref:sodium:solute symporter family protein n=1 Tax=Sphingomonas ursincola TaxID=56361 RepID=UPI0023571830|nr:sodium:solute symporter family protein [Sphingomonas ursincola]MBY0619151.1 sodium:solute symporter family protein [Sphingomonas ursincola]